MSTNVANPTMRLFFLFAGAAAAVGCAAPTDDPPSSDVASESQEYRSFKTLDSDAYTCTISNGTTKTSAVFTRTLFERLFNGERTIVQNVQLAEPVFTAAKRSLGSYGCAHGANEGWGVSTREEKVHAATLEASISVDVNHDTQWSNCDYNATETLSVSGSGRDLRIAFSLASGTSHKVSFAGTCTKKAAP